MSDSDWFAPTKADGTPRVYIGVHRPPVEAFLRGSAIVNAKAWQQGYFDTPMYRDPEDVTA